ncbi:Lrp/AsnC family transcriptional regulator [Paenibacillus shunpengii]|uniref:Lrp/AsnC family transcriptional regulator n=1 Tax=Paenibacillus shunpengii TaxID=2054424 RepID=A0ABW5STN5_9BACL|nr:MULTISPECIES: Lrp/AsnC family transcriptional regulator [unclassified Paenibacillus]OMC65371.1 AsnC family transcriptional regulator [Paenibacillus sp. FSL H7-0326]SDX18377.1 Lrp/AsnC family transcriptional regulator, leucine-responsive regulatory protein [Paenibacillus sp. PDC88]
MKIDRVDMSILTELQKDARLSMRELGRLVNLSAPSVTERVKRMEEQGLIEGYTIQVNRKKLGFTMDCLIEVTLQHGDHKRFKPLIESYPTVLSCYRIAGKSCYMVLLTVSQLDEIEEFIDAISTYANTLTHVIFSEVKVNTSLEQHTPLLPEA